MLPPGTFDPAGADYLGGTMRRVSASVGLVLLFAAIPAHAGEPDPEARSFTIAASGDILIMDSVRQVADAHAPGYRTHDFFPMFARIEPWISSADLAICHIETPLLSAGSSITRASPNSPHPSFSAPPELVDALVATGYDACSTAANHALDWGLDGLIASLDVLDEAGLGHTGTFRSPAENHPSLYEVNGVTVAHGSYTFGTNLIFVPEKWAVNYLDLEKMLSDAAWAREQGAEFVMFSIHWGKDYQVLPSERQLEYVAPLMASPDIDLIVGHHAHVIQPIDVINGKYVVYGMSNHLSNIRGWPHIERNGAEDGMIVHFEVTEQDDGSFEVTDLSYTPTWVHPNTKEIVPVQHTLAYEPGWREGDLRASLRRTVERAGLLGFTGGTTPTPWPAISCRGKVATILGSQGDDLLIGTDGDDVIVTRGGDDAVWAGDGDDLVCLGAGDDFVNGGDGDDYIRAGDGNDLVMGHGGADTLWGGDGDDVVSGLGGSDLIIGEPGDDSLVGGDGDDVIWGGAGHDRIAGGDGIDDCRAAATIASCES